MSAKNLAQTGVILAAGFGSRLKGTVDETSLKPLTPVARVPLIFRTINSLQKAGCTRVIIVLGHGNEEIQLTIEEAWKGALSIDFVYNENFDLKNGVSVLTAKPLINGNFILTMADHILGESLMLQAGKHAPPNNGATLLVDYKIDTIFDLDDATKVQVEDQKIIKIGKEIQSYNCIDTGVFVCTLGLLDALERVYDSQGDVSLSEGIEWLAQQGRMQALNIGDGFWQDVDTPEMLEQAERFLLKEEELSQ